MFNNRFDPEYERPLLIQNVLLLQTPPHGMQALQKLHGHKQKILAPGQHLLEAVPVGKCEKRYFLVQPHRTSCHSDCKFR